MGDVTKAVFLSYASQDAEAAKKICDALRSAGVEVWFDAEGGLEHGDEWDAKIRRQIKECVLFLPIISANTQAREEGYFRIEWELAAQRALGIASGVAFILPVLVDGTKEPDALVPDRFRAVQWTKLPGGNVPPDVLQRFLKLWSHRTGALKTVEAGRSRPAEEQGGADFAKATTDADGTPPPGNSHRLLLVGGAVAAVIALGAWLALRSSSKPAVIDSKADVASASAPAASPESAARTTKVPAVSDRTGTARAVDANDKSIAILPFGNLSEEKDSNAFFADGIQEDVLTNLGSVRDLRVISRMSVAQYRNTTKSVRQIGDELHAAYVLQGSVRRAGGKVRVTGQLIRTATDEQVWARSYDRDLTDIFAVQAELAQDIARALSAALSPQEQASLQRRPTENVAAYEAYLKAREWLQRKSGASRLVSAIELLQQAVNLDPKFALAWAELGDCHAKMAFDEYDRSAARLASARAAIDQATRLAPDDPGVIAKLGSYYYHADRDYARAIEQYLRLAGLRPNDPEVLRALGRIQVRQGRWTEGVASLRHAYELDPGNFGEIRTLLGHLVDGRHYGEAEALAHDLVNREPLDQEAHFWLAAVALLGRGSTAEADAFNRQIIDPDARPTGLYLRRTLARLRGDTAEAIRLDHESPYWEGGEARWAQDVAAAVTFANAGDMEHCRARAAAALTVMQGEQSQQATNSWLFMWMGMAHALLGEKDLALANARHGLEILPESRDAVFGVENAVMNASIHAWVGEKDRALAEFERLLRVPHGINAYTAARGCSSRGVEVSFKPLWDDPHFQALIADPKNNAPLF